MLGGIQRQQRPELLYSTLHAGLLRYASSPALRAPGACVEGRRTAHVHASALCQI